MSALTTAAKIVYPESDGEPIAENSKQFRYIVAIQGGLDDLFRDDPNVFVAGDNFWYPVEGHPEIVTAPDVYVAFGRPKGDRGCYKQWEEGGIPIQVVFEVLSPGNRPGKMREKLEFYDRYGVEEYYVYDPDRGTLEGWRRGGGALRPIPMPKGYVSPRLGVRFVLEGDDLQLFRPDGGRFLTYLELAAERDQFVRQRDEAARRADEAARRADEAARRADEAARQRDAGLAAREKLAAKLRELGVDPDSL